MLNASKKQQQQPKRSPSPVVRRQDDIVPGGQPSGLDTSQPTGGSTDARGPTGRGADHRPNSMERAASHKVEQWLSGSTSRLAADSTLSPKVCGVSAMCIISITKDDLKC